MYRTSSLCPICAYRKLVSTFSVDCCRDECLLTLARARSIVNE